LEEFLAANVVPLPVFPAVSPHFPPLLNALITALLAKDYRTRPRGEEVIQKLEKILAEILFLDVEDDHYALSDRFCELNLRQKHFLQVRQVCESLPMTPICADFIEMCLPEFHFEKFGKLSQLFRHLTDERVPEEFWGVLRSEQIRKILVQKMEKVVCVVNASCSKFELFYLLPDKKEVCSREFSAKKNLAESIQEEIGKI
jgi:hypothetical protein